MFVQPWWQFCIERIRVNDQYVCRGFWIIWSLRTLSVPTAGHLQVEPGKKGWPVIASNANTKGVGKTFTLTWFHMETQNTAPEFCGGIYNRTDRTRIPNWQSTYTYHHAISQGSSGGVGYRGPKAYGGKVAYVGKNNKKTVIVASYFRIDQVRNEQHKCSNTLTLSSWCCFEKWSGRVEFRVRNLEGKHNHQLAHKRLQTKPCSPGR